MNVRIPYYPPLAAAAGGPFFAWLFGSLTWDAVSGDSVDVSLTIVFGIVFVGFALLTVGAWLGLLQTRQTGLFLDDGGVREVSSGFLGLIVRELKWVDVRAVSMDKSTLCFDGHDRSLHVDASGLLESPQWIIDRSTTFLEPERREDVTDVAVELKPLTCVSCAGRVDAPLSETESVTCRSCGTKNPLPDNVRQAIVRVREIVRRIPEAHRQLGRATLIKLLSRGLSFRQGMVLWSWITAGIFLVVGIGGIISDPSDIRFAAAMLAIASSALLFGYGVAFATRALATAYASINQAAPPIEVGGPARCRLCGGDLSGVELVRRCSWCESDSLVTGESLTSAESSALEGLRNAQRLIEQSTDASSAVMDRVAFNLEWLAMLQFLWLQVPIVVALDGINGPLRLTAVCLAVTAANLVAGFVSLRWMRRNRT